MKKAVWLTLFFTMLGLSGSADSVLSGPYGTVAGRIQYLGMIRNYETRTPVEEVYGHSIGLQLGYYSPEWQGFDGGVTYNLSEPIDASDNSDRGGALISNGRFELFNELYGRYRFSAAGLSNTTVTVGRKVTQGEVFKKSDIRQKARGLEGVMIDSRDIPSTRFQIGYAKKMSNSYGKSDIWDYNDFGDVFKTGYDSDGLAWAECVYTGIENLEAAVFNAYAWDITNLSGTRAKYTLREGTSLLGYYRHEESVGRSREQRVDAYGLSVQHKLGDVKLEGGGFTVRGDSLRFMQTTTGFNNHAIGSSLIIYNKQYNGGADTAYLKATTKVGKLSLYSLYLHTWHRELSYHAQEFNVIAKYPLMEQMLLQFKGGVGHRDQQAGGEDTTATDLRVFLTYSF